MNKKSSVIATAVVSVVIATAVRTYFQMKRDMEEEAYLEKTNAELAKLTKDCNSIMKKFAEYSHTVNRNIEETRNIQKEIII